MIKEYKQELLKSLGVYELRELARSLGVIAPTTKKRKQLEQEIMKISCGEMVPEPKKTKKGRPPKSIRKVESVFDVFVPKELLELKLNKKVDKKLEDTIHLSSSEIVNQDINKMSGYLRKTISGHYYFKNSINTEEFASIPQDVVKMFSLIEGDKITAFCTQTPTENFYILKEITSVNNNAPSTKRQLSNLNNIVLSKLALQGFEGVNEGQNVFLVTEELKPGIESIKKAFERLSHEYSLVVVAPSVSTYTKLVLEKYFKGEVIYSLVEDHPANVYDSAVNACNHINSLLQEGKKVVALVLDIFTLINSIENFFVLENQKQTAQEEIEAIRIAKKLFNFGKVLEDNASVTIFGHCLTSEAESDLFKREFSKLADKVFYL